MHTNRPPHLHGHAHLPEWRSRQPVRVILATKNFAANRHISHIGLGVASLNTAKVLRSLGLTVDAWAIVSAQDLMHRFAADGGDRVTHVVISAPWIPTLDLQGMLVRYPNVHWTVCSHSNLGFLQADAHGVQRFREALDLQHASHNFHVAGNSPVFCQWVEQTFHAPCLWLPNLYYLNHHAPVERPLWHGGTLRIGSFSAIRPLKNLMTAAAAALHIGMSLRADLEFWLSGGRNEGGGGTIEQAIKAMYAGLPNAKVVQQTWQTWPDFKRTVSHMHLLIQPSYTESFSMVAADAITEGVPVVGSEAIYWLPEHNKAHLDHAADIARVGQALLASPHATRQAFQALQAHDDGGEHAWLTFLRTTAHPEEAR